MVKKVQEGLLRPPFEGVSGKPLEYFANPLIKVTTQGPMERLLGVDEVLMAKAIGFEGSFSSLLRLGH